MAIVAVQQTRRDDRREKKDPLIDLLNVVSRGLNIAQGIYGIKTANEKSELMALQKQATEQQIALGEQKIARGERLTRLETKGIMPAEDFNKEYMAVTDQDTLEGLKEEYDFPLHGVRIRVEDPSQEQGFSETFAIPRQALAEAQKAKVQGQATLAKSEKEKAAITAKAEKEKSFITKKTDEAFAREYSKYVSEGEEAQIYDTIGKLDLLITDAEKNLSGGLDEQLMGMMPDKLRDIIDANDKSIEDRLKSEAQKSLRQTLGAQFTEKEGKMILDRAYNPAQPKEENIRRMKELAKSIRARADSKKAAMDYFAREGTISGFGQPVTPTIMPGVKKRPKILESTMAPAPGIKKPVLKDEDFISDYLNK